MPVPGFLSSFADKAQNAINSSPIASHIPGARPTSPGSAAQPSANQAAATGPKNHTLENLQYQLRAFGQQYSSTTPVQKLITNEKGVAIDFDSVSRDAKSQSKELYTWGQNENADLKDVTDRLAYLNFVQGSLASSLAVKLDAARTPLKALRDAETALAPRRTARANLQTQIARTEHDGARGNEKKLADLKEQLAKAESDDVDAEKEVELLKRKGVKESERLKWEALREYGEKLVLLSHASEPIIAALPSVPPSAKEPYAGAPATAAARASLQRALDNYKTGHINLPSQTGASDLSRSDTRSFGETHASELSTISTDVGTGSAHPGLPVTPPPKTSAEHPPTSYKPDAAHSRTSSGSPPINTQNLNNTPTTLPPPSTSPATRPAAAPVAAPDPINPTQVPAITPTVAETGVPVSAGAGGPGPASGSLRDIKGAAPSAGPRSGGLAGNESQDAGFGQSGARFESAEDEKKRLQREDRERVLSTGGGQPPQHESAEDEKKRLEREERERVLAAGAAPHANQGQGDERRGPDGEDLPPYQDI
ncbi:hypothetical protein PLICRDRAFT_99320 [Plicaturopsis crispa FD-325 SS-3]|nr:hypothetical protein PLICRDRAFT_99320 [Plicaturopsis crispa FD-325 SS-3]